VTSGDGHQIHWVGLMCSFDWVWQYHQMLEGLGYKRPLEFHRRQTLVGAVQETERSPFLPPASAFDFLEQQLQSAAPQSSPEFQEAQAELL
jgi:hypothetical protein